MKVASPLLLATLTLLAGAGCDESFYDGFRDPYTRVLVYNRTLEGFELPGKTVASGYSQAVRLFHGTTLDVPLTRDGALLGTIVLTSLVDKAEPADYDGAVTVYTNAAQELHLLEMSPWFDATIEGK